jgi:hypothetical protein
MDGQECKVIWLIKVTIWAPVMSTCSKQRPNIFLGPQLQFLTTLYTDLESRKAVCFHTHQPSIIMLEIRIMHHARTLCLITHTCTCGTQDASFSPSTYPGRTLNFVPAFRGWSQGWFSAHIPPALSTKGCFISPNIAMFYSMCCCRLDASVSSTGWQKRTGPCFCSFLVDGPAIEICSASSTHF